MSIPHTLKKLPLFRKSSESSWDGSLTLEDIMQGITGLPGYLRVSITEDCDERCFFCHNEGNTGREKVVDDHILKEAIRASIELGKTKFKFTGGEPTLHPDLVKYVAWVRSECPEAEIGIATNAITIGSIALQLYDAGLNSATISLHSLNPKTYRLITQRDELESALQGMVALQKAGIYNITINMVISKINLSEVKSMQAFADANGYKLRLLDILPSNPKLRKLVVNPKDISASFPNVELKPKIFHEKCGGCDARPMCGEGEYLRLSVDDTLIPCLYREDLYIPLERDDLPEITLKKVALGFRRIEKDDK